MLDTSVAQLVQADKGLVNRKIFNDQELYQQELEQIFGRSWLFVAHESQISKLNDFAANYMAEDPVLVTRDGKGKVHTFLNMCRHRGNRICRADFGNAPSFMCTYHGWTFATDGKLVGVPGYKEAYFEELDRSQWGLVEAQTDTYKGLVFANWDRTAPSLLDYLGDATWYMDLWLDRTAGGTEVLGGAHRWVMNFNWKFGADNFGGDTYHTLVSHGSMSASGMTGPRRQQVNPDKNGFQVSIGNGHCFIGGYLGSQSNPQVVTSRFANDSAVSDYIQSINKEMTDRLGLIRGRQAAMGIGTLFPNMTWHGSPLVRAWHPRGPLKTEIWSYCVVDRNAPKEVKEKMRINYTQRFGPSGNMEEDDANNWMGSTELAKSRKGREYPLNMQMALGKQWKNETHPAVALNYPWSDTNWLHFYSRWAEVMGASSWSNIHIDPKTAK